MSKARVIGGHLKIAFENLVSAKRIGMDRRDSVLMIFYAVENIVLATFIAEEIDLQAVRARKGGNHHLDMLVDELPAECPIKERLLDISAISEFSTTYRYPLSTGKVKAGPGEQQTKAWFIEASEILQALVRHFQVNIKEDDPIAAKTGPFRDVDPREGLSL